MTSKTRDLGNALQTLGAPESGTAGLEEVVAAFRAALEEGTRDRVPLDWTTSIGNQGLAMMQLADRKKDENKNDEAVQVQIGNPSCRADRLANSDRRSKPAISIPKPFCAAQIERALQAVVN